MFWVGLFTGIVIYLVFTLIMVVVTKHKMKKKKQHEQDYQTLVNNEINKNYGNRKD